MQFRIGARARNFFLISCGVLVVFSLGRRVWKNLEGVRRIAALKKEISCLIEENKRLKRELERRESLEFVEREAREKLGMVREGEKMVVLPRGEGKEGGAPAFGPSRKVSYWREWARVFGW